VAELAMATGLPLVATLRLRFPADRLPIGDARRAHVDLDAELVLQVMNSHLDRRLADRREDRLVRRILAANVESRILVGELVQRGGELVEVGFARRLDGDRERGRREVDGGVEDDGVLVAEGGVRRGRGELWDRADVACT